MPGGVGSGVKPMIENRGNLTLLAASSLLMRVLDFAALQNIW